MKQNQRNLCLEYHAAPTMHDPANRGQMSPIRLELPSGGPYDVRKMYHRILAGEIRGDSRGDFRKWLPQALSGKFSTAKPDDWILWHVRISPQQLQLLYSRRSPLAEQDDPDPFNLNIAQLTVTSPEALVCDFIVPPVLGEPEKCVRYNFVRYDEIVGKPPRWCELRVIETAADEVKFRYTLKTPFTGVCDAEPAAIKSADSEASAINASAS